MQNEFDHNNNWSKDPNDDTSEEKEA